MSEETMQEKAHRLVHKYIVSRLEKTDIAPQFDTYTVWFCKTLQNWKALVSTTLPDGMYYEVTYNGDKGETYIDAYKKFDNICVVDENHPKLEDVLTSVKHPENVPASYR